MLYAPLKSFHWHTSVDVAVAVRSWRAALLPFDAQKIFFWTGDAADQFNTVGLGDKRIIDTLTGIFSVSSWHGQTLAESSGFPKEKVYFLGNGVHLPYFENSSQKKMNRLYYSSTPYRGLAHLPALFKEIRKIHPDAEAHIFSGYQTYGGAAHQPPSAIAELNAIKAMCVSIEGIVWRGNLSQADLASEIIQSSILVYPNTFEETSCITAMEAMAGGCVVVTSKLGALPETVGEGGIVIDGVPGTASYDSEFVKVVCNLLSDKEKLSAWSKKNHERRDEFGWERVAERFEKLAR